MLDVQVVCIGGSTLRMLGGYVGSAVVIALHIQALIAQLGER